MFEKVKTGIPVQITYNISDENKFDEICLYLGIKNEKYYVFDGEYIFGFGDDYIKEKDMVLKFNKLDEKKILDIIEKAKKQGIFKDS